jgi:hypothetical protein
MNPGLSLRTRVELGDHPRDGVSRLGDPNNGALRLVGVIRGHQQTSRFGFSRVFSGTARSYKGKVLRPGVFE